MKSAGETDPDLPNYKTIVIKELHTCISCLK